jgi:hypothetical protein
MGAMHTWLGCGPFAKVVLAGRKPMLLTAETSPQFRLYVTHTYRMKKIGAIYDLCPYITRHNFLFLHFFRFG